MAAVEERFAQRLASNDLPVRNRALKRLNKWIEERSALKDGFTDMELLKLWKGLHVCMWHSDKPLVQEELAENIAKLIYVFKMPDRALQFVSAFFATMSREWLGIDRLRLDKYYTLIRKVMGHTFRFLQQNQWNSQLVQSFAALMSEGPLNRDSVKACLGVQLHVVEVFIPELLSAIAADAEECPSVDLLAPTLTLLANTTNSSVTKCITINILQPLEDDKKIHVCCDRMSQRLRQLAIDRRTVGRNRKKLYTLYKRFSAKSEMAQSTDSTVRPPPKKRKRKQ